MARPSTKDLVAAAAEEAVQKALAQRTESSGGDLTSNAQDSMNDQEEQAIQNGEDDRDVFDLAVERIQKFNDSVVYEIYKDGVRLGTKSHPYSWDKLQAELGAGLYRVVGRSIRTKKIFKHSTLPLGEALKSEETESFTFGEETHGTAPAPGASISELLLFMDRQENNRRRESEAAEERRRQADREARERNADLLKTLLGAATTVLPALLGRKEEKSVDQNVMEFLRATVDNQNKMIERLQDRVEKRGGQSDDPMSAFSLMQEMEDRAFSRIKLMEDLAREKAEEIAALSGGRDHDDKPKSVFDSMMTTMLPAIAKGIVGLSGMPAVDEEMETEETQPTNVQPIARRSLPAQSASQSQEPARRAEPAQAGARSPQSRPQGPSGQRPARPSPKPAGFLGLPVASKPVSQSVSQSVPVSQSATQPQTKTPGLKAVVLPHENKTMPLKERTLEILVPYIGHALQSRVPAEQAAVASLELLEKSGVKPAIALPEFTWETIQKVADSYSIPALMRPAVNSWLKTYHTKLIEESQTVASA